MKGSELATRHAVEHTLAAELRYAIERTPESELSAWARRAGKRFLTAGTTRITGFGALIATLTVMSAEELSQLIAACGRGDLGIYAEGRKEKAQAFAGQIAERGSAAFKAVSETLESRPQEAATHLVSLVVGFYCGSGGNGDGGIPDLDLLGGIGAHRSIFTHSIIAGVFVETAVMSMVDLVQVVHGHLPEEHATFWDELKRHAEVGGSTFVSGASIGIATHLGIDTFIDGFTPYKDLPISISQFSHELLLGLNAGVEGAHGVRRYVTDVEDLIGTTETGGAHCRREQAEVSEYKPRFLIQKPEDAPVTGVIDSQRVATTREEDRFTLVVDAMRNINTELGVDTLKVEEAVSSARRAISHANEPFRLGVVGEFRVGKSTLINALLGYEVAFTDFMEATPVLCRFVKGSELGASIVYSSGDRLEVSVSACNELLDQHRHDSRWVESVKQIEYSVPADVLDSIDLWDAPGLGGSDDNDALAQDYIAMLGGGIWVVDATLVGKAAVANPIARMHADGKPVICVLNRIDEVDGDVSQLRDWMHESYPGLFAEVIPFSAQRAVDEGGNGVVSEGSRELWEIIRASIGSDADAGNRKRTELIELNAATRVAIELETVRRDIEDRRGALEYYEESLRDAKRQSLEKVTIHLNSRADSVFNELQTRVEGELAKSNWSPKAVDRIIDLLSDGALLSEVSQKVGEECLQLVVRDWTELSAGAMSLVAAAVPIKANSKAKQGAAVTDARRTEEAINAGVYAGGMAAIATGTLAAISTIVTWPIILAAIPVGALAMWKKKQDLGSSKVELVAQVSGLVEAMKGEYLSRALTIIKSQVEGAIDAELVRLMREKRSSISNGADQAELRSAIAAVESLEHVLGVSQTIQSKSSWSSDEFIEMMRNPGARLDIVTPYLDFSLSPILAELPASTEVRLIFPSGESTKEELQSKVKDAFDNWPGKRKIRAVSTEHGVALKTMLIMQERCLVSDGDLGTLAERSLDFLEFEGGKLAAQHQFATLWEGGVHGGAQVVSTPVH